MALKQIISRIWHGRGEAAGDQTLKQKRSLESPAFQVSATLLDQMWGYGPTRSGVQINEQTALTYVAVFGAIRILAETLGMLPTKIYQGAEEDQMRQPAVHHPLYHLLRYRPNAEMSAAVFKECLTAHLAGWGNAYARIVFGSDGEPKALLPLLPDRTYPERQGGQLRYVVQNGGVYAPEEILHFRGFGFNGLKGYSPIALAREAIATGKATEIFGSTFFGQGANSRGVLETAQKLDPKQMNSLRESWDQQYAGVQNANRTAILPSGVTYKPTSIAPDDAQFLGTRQFNILEVARIYRIPPHMLAEMTRTTHSNIEQAGQEFLTYTISPYLEKWEEELNAKLLAPGSGYSIRFDERRLLRADMTARQQWYASARQWGVLSANDVRREEGLPPVAGGDIYLSPINMAPAELVASGAALQAGQGEKGLKGGKGEKGAGGPGAGGGGAATGKEGEGQGGSSGLDGKDEGRSHAAAMLPVFEDCIGRMLRKEQNALSRGNGNEKFYVEHQRHVVEALTAPADSLCRLLGRKGNGAVLPVLRGFSENEGLAKRTIDVDAAARNLAALIIDDILESTEVQHGQ